MQVLASVFIASQAHAQASAICCRVESEMTGEAIGDDFVHVDGGGALSAPVGTCRFSPSQFRNGEVGSERNCRLSSGGWGDLNLGTLGYGTPSFQ